MTWILTSAASNCLGGLGPVSYSVLSSQCSHLQNGSVALWLWNFLLASHDAWRGKFLKRWEYLTCLLRNLYACQEATLRTWYRAMDWLKIEKGVCQGCVLSPCLFNLYAEHIMQNARLDESQAGIKIAGRNINNLRYADDTTLVAESKEELKSLLMRVKEESEKAGLKLSIQKLTSWRPVSSLHGK